jgi:hypothetical protein
MPSLGEQLVRSPAFALDLHGRDPATFMSEVEDGAVRIVGRYVPRTEALRSWDILGSNVCLNRVFELNRLPYGGYPRDDAVVAVDHRGKRPMAVTDEGPSQEAAPGTKKRKIGTAVGGLGVSDSFAMELMGTCAALGGRMSSPELHESLAQMLRVTEGRWPKNVSIPRAAGEDMFTSRMARELKIFPYGRNIAAVVSAVMEKDRQDAASKHRVVVRIGDPFREAKKARGARSLPPSAAANWRRLRSRPPLGPGSLRQVRRRLLLAWASHPLASWRRGKSCPRRRVLTRRRHVLPTSTQISTSEIILEVSFFGLGRNQDRGAGSDVGQLAVVPTPVVATSPMAAIGVKGASQDPWSAFCASGTILSAAAAKDMVGSMSRQLRQASQQLSQQLKHVSCVGLR